MNISEINFERAIKCINAKMAKVQRDINHRRDTTALKHPMFKETIRDWASRPDTEQIIHHFCDHDVMFCGCDRVECCKIIHTLMGLKYEEPPWKRINSLLNQSNTLVQNMVWHEGNLPPQKVYYSKQFSGDDFGL